MKNLYILVVFLFALNDKTLAYAVDDTTKINCYYNQVFENFCATCIDQISYEVFTGIEVEKYDSTYRIYPPYKIFDEDTFTVIQDVYNNLVYIDLDTTIFANKEDVAEYIASCVGDTSILDVTSKQDKIQWKNNYTDKGSLGSIKKVNIVGTGVTVEDSTDWLNITIDSSIVSGSDCNCCDSLYYYRNDSIAHASGGFNKFDYYTTANINDYGWSWGFLRQIITDVGYEIINGMVVAIESVIGFTGSDPECKFNAPASTLNEYRNDSTALANGLTKYVSWYKLSEANDYGAPKWTIKRVSE